MKKILLLSAILLCAVWISYGQWTYTNLSSPKESMGVASLSSNAYFAGGNDGTNTLSLVESYDIGTGTWANTGSLSIARWVISGVACGSKLFFAGGVNFNGGIVYSTVDIYDIDSAQWSVQELSLARMGIAAVSKGTKVLFAGGSNWNLLCTNIVDIYNISTGTWSTDYLSSARGGMAYAVVGDLAVFAGGFINGGGVSSQVDIYNFVTNEWSTASLSEARVWASAVTVNDKVIIAGGIKSFPGVPSDRVDIFNASDGIWTTATLSEARAWISAGAVNGKAYFAGGSNVANGGIPYDFSNMIDVYDEASNSWYNEQLAQQRTSQGLSVGDYFIVAGGSSDGGLLSSVEIFHDPTLIYVPDDYSSIQEAILAASDGDTVLVAEETYYENINFNGKAILVASEFILDGDTNHISNTIIDGSQLTDIDNASVVAFKSGEDTTSILCGFTIQGGRGTWDSDLNNRCGGGIFISGSGAKIIYNKITANTVDDTQQGNGQETYGGGIGTSHEDAGYWIVIEHNQIYNNSAVTQYGWSAGGGIYDSYNARIADNIIFENTSLATTNGWGSGGGFSHIDLDGGEANTLIILNNKFHHNTAQSISGYGVDGAASTVNAQLTFIGNEITANIGITAVNGGGGGGVSVIDPAENCLVSRNIFRENLGTIDGGALILENFSQIPNPNLVEVRENYFINNQGTYGGAVRDNDIPVIFQNNVFHGNKASLRGGAIFMQKSTSYPFIHLVTLINNSFSSNSAENLGGAIYSIKAKPMIFNSIFFNDTADTSRSEIYSNYPSDTVIIAFCNIDTSLIYGNGYVDDAGGNINADPGFTGTGENPLSLMEGSPCIDSGTTDTTGLNLPIWDIIGNFRLWDGDGDLDTIVDMGAYEYGSIPFDVGIPSINNPIHRLGYNIQSYPNPFSNFTTLEYELEHSANVNLSIYNHLGQRVAVLVDGEQAAEKQQVRWEAEEMPAGIYFYQLRAEGFGQGSAGKLVKY